MDRSQAESLAAFINENEAGFNAEAEWNGQPNSMTTHSSYYVVRRPGDFSSAGTAYESNLLYLMDRMKDPDLTVARAFRDLHFPKMVIPDTGQLAPPTDWLAKPLIRDIPDYPKQGILFRDITPVLGDYRALRQVVEVIGDWAERRQVDYVVGVESRGFIIGVPVAMEIARGFIPVRKAGKLPHEVEKMEYDLEYATAVIEVHRDCLKPGDRVVVIDDLLATGGTALASARLMERLGAVVKGVGFMVEIEGLGGREALAGYDIFAMISYPKGD